MQKLSIKLSPFQTIDIEAEKSQDIIRVASFWQSLPTTCPKCSAGLVYEYSTPKTFKYYKLKCTGPEPHSVNLSERSDGSGMYFDNRKPWEIWRAGVSDDDAAEMNRSDAMADPANAPDTERGQMIAEILRLAAEKKAAGKTVNLKLDDLGSRQSPGLESMIKYLESL